MRITYTSDDGQTFDSEEACLKHEAYKRRYREWTTLFNNITIGLFTHSEGNSWNHIRNTIIAKLASDGYERPQLSDEKETTNE